MEKSDLQKEIKKMMNNKDVMRGVCCNKVRKMYDVMTSYQPVLHFGPNKVNELSLRVSVPFPSCRAR